MVAAFPIGFITRVCRALALLEKIDSGLRALPATAQVGGAPLGGWVDSVSYVLCCVDSGLRALPATAQVGAAPGVLGCLTVCALHMRTALRWLLPSQLVPLHVYVELLRCWRRSTRGCAHCQQLHRWVAADCLLLCAVHMRIAL
jgi:hypothetical protein